MGLFVLLLLFLAQRATHMPARCWPKVFTQMAAVLQLIVQQTHLSGFPAGSGLTMGWDKGQTMHYLSPPNLRLALCWTGASQSWGWFTLWEMLRVSCSWVHRSHRRTWRQKNPLTNTAKQPTQIIIIKKEHLRPSHTTNVFFVCD